MRWNRARIRSIARSRLSGVSSASAGSSSSERVSSVERVSRARSPPSSRLSVFFRHFFRRRFPYATSPRRPSSSLALNLAAPAPVTDHSGSPFASLALLALYHSNSVERTCSSDGCALCTRLPATKTASAPHRFAHLELPKASRIRPLQTVVTSPRSWQPARRAGRGGDRSWDLLRIVPDVAARASEVVVPADEVGGDDASEGGDASGRGPRGAPDAGELVRVWDARAVERLHRPSVGAQRRVHRRDAPLGVIATPTSAAVAGPVASDERASPRGEGTRRTSDGTGFESARSRARVSIRSSQEPSFVPAAVARPPLARRM